MTNPSSDASLLAKIASLTEILSKDAHSTAFVPLSDAYRQMGLLEDALEIAEKGVNALPQFSPGHMILGRIFFELGNLEAAAGAFEAAYSIDNRSLPAIKGLVRVLSRQGDHTRARQLLEEGARIDPGDATIQKMLAAVPPAHPTPAQTEMVRTKEPIATSTIAEIYLQQGFPDRALKVYLDLLAKHPDNIDVKRKVAEIADKVQQTTSIMPMEKKVDSPPPTENFHSVSGHGGGCASSEERPPFLPGDSDDNSEREVAELNRWLSAIRARRQNAVQ